ncbi:hypothetical protein BJ742DRAFT_858802 [Cladochytrium replicatum]|nr:hypothetical protein BJ742DRAFT_858802 [Cladochytrium replicatum]
MPALWGPKNLSVVVLPEPGLSTLVDGLIGTASPLQLHGQILFKNTSKSTLSVGGLDAEVVGEFVARTSSTRPFSFGGSNTKSFVFFQSRFPLRDPGRDSEIEVQASTPLSLPFRIDLKPNLSQLVPSVSNTKFRVVYTLTVRAYGVKRGKETIEGSANFSLESLPVRPPKFALLDDLSAFGRKDVTDMFQAVRWWISLPLVFIPGDWFEVQYQFQDLNDTTIMSSNKINSIEITLYEIMSLAAGIDLGESGNREKKASWMIEQVTEDGWGFMAKRGKQAPSLASSPLAPSQNQEHPIVNPTGTWGQVTISHIISVTVSFTDRNWRPVTLEHEVFVLGSSRISVLNSHLAPLFEKSESLPPNSPPWSRDAHGEVFNDLADTAERPGPSGSSPAHHFTFVEQVADDAPPGTLPRINAAKVRAILQSKVSVNFDELDPDLPSLVDPSSTTRTTTAEYTSQSVDPRVALTQSISQLDIHSPAGVAAWAASVAAVAAVDGLSSAGVSTISDDSGPRNDDTRDVTPTPRMLGHATSSVSLRGTPAEAAAVGTYRDPRIEAATALYAQVPGAAHVYASQASLSRSNMVQTSFFDSLSRPGGDPAGDSFARLTPTLLGTVQRPTALVPIAYIDPDHSAHSSTPGRARTTSHPTPPQHQVNIAAPIDPEVAAAAMMESDEFWYSMLDETYIQAARGGAGAAGASSSDNHRAREQIRRWTASQNMDRGGRAEGWQRVKPLSHSRTVSASADGGPPAPSPLRSQTVNDAQRKGKGAELFTAQGGTSSGRVGDDAVEGVVPLSTVSLGRALGQGSGGSPEQGMTSLGMDVEMEDHDPEQNIVDALPDEEQLTMVVNWLATPVKPDKGKSSDPQPTSTAVDAAPRSVEPSNARRVPTQLRTRPISLADSINDPVAPYPRRRSTAPTTNRYSMGSIEESPTLAAPKIPMGGSPTLRRASVSSMSAIDIGEPHRRNSTTHEYVRLNGALSEEEALRLALEESAKAAGVTLDEGPSDLHSAPARTSEVRRGSGGLAAIEEGDADQLELSALGDEHSLRPNAGMVGHAPRGSAGGINPYASRPVRGSSLATGGPPSVVELALERQLQRVAINGGLVDDEEALRQALARSLVEVTGQVNPTA